MNKNILIVVDDIHLEGRPQEMQDDFANIIRQKIVSIKEEKNTPILICAGDISEKDRGLDWVKQFECDIIYVCGNHEFWNNDYYEVIETLKEKVKLPEYKHINFLHNESIVLHGVRFLGGTMWADLAKSWAWIKRNYVLKHFFSMADFRKITAKKFYNNQEDVDNMFKLLLANGVDEEQITNTISKQLYNPYLQMEENRKTVEFIEDKMLEQFDGETVVVTHHLPIPNFWMKVNEMNEQILAAPHINNKALYERYQKQKIEVDKDILMMGFYVNTSYQFFEHNFSPDLWIHGHFHKPVDGFIGTTRIVSNPVGYLKQSSQLNLKEIELGNKLKDYTEYAKKHLEEYDWDRKILNTVNSCKKALTGIIEMTDEDNYNQDYVKPIINSFKKQHEQNLKEVEREISSILYSLIKLINKDIDVPDHLYVTSFVSGFSRWASKNKVVGIGPLNFSINEKSFVSEKELKKMEEKDKACHCTQWLSIVDNVIEQTDAFKNQLIAFLEDVEKNPKLEDNYINNID